MERKFYTTDWWVASCALLFVLTCSIFNVNASDSGGNEKATTTGTDIKPSFPGGELAMFSYVEERLKCPEVNWQEQTTTVIASFVVNKKGKIKEVSIEQGVNAKCNAALIQVINSMPLWNPGRLKGKRVEATYTLPVKL